MNKNLPLQFSSPECDKCNYFKGLEFEDFEGGHCGYDGSKGDGMCGANTTAEVKK